jgi:glycosyltransferase involved in cell wall biosynthesis
MADFVVLATADWDHPLWTNKQHTALTLAAAGHRVLYVESLGIRPPRVGAADRSRIVRRLRRLLQLPRQRSERLWVWSPPVLPGGHSGKALQLNRTLLQGGLELVCRWLGFSNPILWTYNPLTTLYLKPKQFAASVYHCVDRIQDQPGMPVAKIELNEQALSCAVDVVFVTSPELQATHRCWNPRTYLFGNVADHQHFSRARSQPNQASLEVPALLQTLSHPRLLFMGAIDAYKLDLSVLLRLAQCHPHWTFVLIGPVGECDPSTDVGALQACSNVHFVGPVAYGDLPNWCAHVDLALLPLQINGYTRNMFPMKFFEYLSSGLPVVATAIPSLLAHDDVAWLCPPMVEAFEQAIAAALAGQGPPLEQRLARASSQTYGVRTSAMLEVLQDLGVLSEELPESQLPPRSVVLYIDSLKLGGAERVTLTWAEWLHRHGWPVVVLTRKPVSWDFYPLPQGLVREVEPNDPAWMRLLGPLAFPFRVVRLRNWLQRQQVILAIGVTSLPAIKLLLATRLLNLPCVVSERNYPPLKPIGLIWSALRRVSYPWAALHLVQTRAAGDWMAEHLAAKRQLLLPNPVQWPLPTFQPCVHVDEWLAQAGVQTSDPVLLAVGTKAQQKGFDRLLRWWVPLAQRDSSLQLVIVGLDDRPYHGRNQQDDLRRLLQSTPDLLHRLHFPGRVGNVADWYSRSQIFVLSSRYEGFPNVLLEAMAAGCCCVAADCPQGPADLISDGVNGRLLPSDASDRCWVQCLDELLRTPKERQRLAEEAILVRERYAQERLRDQMLKALQGVINLA